MAILLIKAVDATNIDPIKDKHCYKQGDVVEVFDDDMPCNLPPAPPFWIVKINGLSKEAAQKYMQQYNVEDKIDTRRLYGISISSLPKLLQNKLEKERWFEVNWNDIRTLIVNKLTLETE